MLTDTWPAADFWPSTDTWGASPAVTPGIPAWTPAASVVVLYIPNRTQPPDGSGEALGQFTDQTRPTLTQVNQLCAIVARQVEAACGITLPADLTDSASDVAALGAAARVEMSYYRDTDSRYAELDAQYEQDLKMLVEAVIARRDNVSIPGDGDTPELPPSPLGTFPPPRFIRFNERW